METLSITTLTVEKVLHGDKDININDNIKLYNAVSKYIIATKRFKVVKCNEPSCEALIFPYGVVLFNIFSTICI